MLAYSLRLSFLISLFFSSVAIHAHQSVIAPPEHVQIRAEVAAIREELDRADFREELAGIKSEAATVVHSLNRETLTNRVKTKLPIAFSLSDAKSFATFGAEIFLYEKVFRHFHSQWIDGFIDTMLSIDPEALAAYQRCLNGEARDDDSKVGISAVTKHLSRAGSASLKIGKIKDFLVACALIGSVLLLNHKTEFKAKDAPGFVIRTFQAYQDKQLPASSLVAPARFFAFGFNSFFAQAWGRLVIRNLSFLTDRMPVGYRRSFMENGRPFLDIILTVFLMKYSMKNAWSFCFATFVREPKNMKEFVRLLSECLAAPARSVRRQHLRKKLRVFVEKAASLNRKGYYAPGMRSFINRASLAASFLNWSAMLSRSSQVYMIRFLGLFDR